MNVATFIHGCAITCKPFYVETVLRVYGAEKDREIKIMRCSDVVEMVRW